MSSAVLTADLFQRNSARPPRNYRSLRAPIHGGQNGMMRKLYRRAMRLSQRVTTFYNPALEQNLFLRTSKPSRYQDATAFRVQEEKAHGKKVEAKAAETAAPGGKGVKAAAGKLIAAMKSIGAALSEPAPGHFSRSLLEDDEDGPSLPGYYYSAELPKPRPS